MTNKLDTKKIDISRAQRCYKAEIRAVTSDNTDAGEQKKHTIRGIPVVYGSETVIGGMFRERIEPGALDGTDLTDVLLFINHDIKKVPLARSRRNNVNSTMRLSVDNQHGLVIDADLDVERNSEASALYSAIEREDMDGMSFAFKIEACEWEDLDTDLPLRRITKIAKIYEVSVVNFPAYSDTSVTAARNDELALESARLELENARSHSVETDEQRAAAELELEKAKALFKMKFC